MPGYGTQFGARTKASATIQEVDSRPDVTERSINSVSILPRPGNMVLKMTSKVVRIIS